MYYIINTIKIIECIFLCVRKKLSHRTEHYRHPQHPTPNTQLVFCIQLVFLNYRHYIFCFVLSSLLFFVMRTKRQKAAIILFGRGETRALERHNQKGISFPLLTQYTTRRTTHNKQQTTNYYKLYNRLKLMAFRF